MTIIRYNELEKYLSALKKAEFPSVFLLYGDEFLYKKALEDIVNALIPPSGRAMNTELMEGTTDNVYEVIEKLNTFGLLAGPKVITLSEAKIFYSHQDMDPLMEKAKRAAEAADYKRASGYVVSILGRLNLSFDEIKFGAGDKRLNMEENGEWIHPIIDHCMENGVIIPAEQEITQSLEKAIEKGFPRNNHLIITTDKVTKQHHLFKIISDKGLLVDCSVPTGDRMADKKVQESVANDNIRNILKKNKKIMGKDAHRALYEMTGFDLRTLAGNLEKLIHYAGDREEITKDDVHVVLARSKKDPIYEFTNAVAERALEKSLFYLSSLLSGGIIEHPLQILSAIINQIRRLLLMKDFAESPYGKAWHKECGYDLFRSTVLPNIQEYDTHLVEEIESWQIPSPDKTGAGKQETPGDKKQNIKRTSRAERRFQDLLIARNPNNPYPIYIMMKHSENFTRQHLIDAIEQLNAADIRLKSSPPSSHKLVLEETVLAICAKTTISDQSSGVVRRGVTMP